MTAGPVRPKSAKSISPVTDADVLPEQIRDTFELTDTPLNAEVNPAEFPSAFTGARAALTGTMVCPNAFANLYESPVDPVF